MLSLGLLAKASISVMEVRRLSSSRAENAAWREPSKYVTASTATPQDAAVHNFLWRDHSRHLSGAPTEAHNVCSALLVGLQVSQHNPEGNVCHERPEAVVLITSGDQLSGIR